MRIVPVASAQTVPPNQPAQGRDDRLEKSVRAVWKKDQHRRAYATTAIAFEKIYFGRREATRQTFDECLKHFRGVFREEESPTAAV